MFKLLANSARNLGVAETVLVTLRALPLLKGNISVKRIIMDTASVSMASVTKIAASAPLASWPVQHDIAGSLKALGDFLDRIAVNVESAGLDEVLLGDTKLVGFDGLRLRSRTARIVSLKLEKDVNFQAGLFLRAVIEAEYANWSIGGAWRRLDDGTKSLDLKIAGADLQEFFASASPDDPEAVYADSPFGFMLNIPYSKEGEARQAVARVDVDKGRLRLDSDYDTSLLAARFNFRILPEKNQIELERSPIQVPTATMNLIGGLKFPQTGKGGGIPKQTCV